MHCSSASLIFSIDKACNVWHLCADVSAKSIVTFKVKSFKHNPSTGCNVFRKSRNVLTSQMSWCFGRVGLVSYTPFRNRQTEGWFPNDKLFGNMMMDDKALLAVFNALYPMP